MEKNSLFPVSLQSQVTIGRHEKFLVMIPYQRDGNTLTPVTIHATNRQQIISRVKSGRLRNE